MFQYFKKAFGKTEEKGLTDPALLELFGALPTAAGKSVTADSALQCATVFACIKILSESVAQLPLHLYERGEDGSKERANDHPLYELLNGNANDWTSAAEFRAIMQASVCLHGNAYAFINRTGDQINELIPVPATSVAVDADTLTLEPRYKITTADGNQRVYDRTEIFHLRTFGTNGLTGLSPIASIREAIGLCLAMEEHASRLFGQGARPSGIFKTGKPLGTEALKRLRDSFNASHSGNSNTGRTLILEDGMDFEATQFTSVDLQFLEMRRHQIAEIARTYRVPLHMLQELERTTHNNAEHMGRQFLTFTLLPHLKMWEGAIHRSLLTPEERQTYYAEFLTDDLARADLAARFEAYSKAVTNGLLSPNEIRAAENRAPYEGGDQFRLPMNTEDARGAQA